MVFTQEGYNEYLGTKATTETPIMYTHNLGA